MLTLGEDQYFTLSQEVVDKSQIKDLEHCSEYNDGKYMVGKIR